MKSTYVTPRKPELNVKLLRKIQKHILEEPKRFMMEAFITRGEPNSKVPVWQRHHDQAATFPACGTAACIAGWACVLSGKLISHISDFDHTAGRLLHLKAPRSLFRAAMWPEPFNAKYIRASGPKERAKVAVARIEHLITTGE